MNLLLITMLVSAVIIIPITLKLRSMPKYRIIKEKSTSDNSEKWFVKIRKGFSYRYLTQTHDAPGYENDIFKTTKYQDGGQKTEVLAEKIIINHRMTTVNGIEVEGE